MAESQNSGEVCRQMEHSEDKYKHWYLEQDLDL
jgi:hypothetical protein